MYKLKIKKLFMFALIGVILLSANTLFSQSQKATTFTSTITINGTSNLHDWNTKVEQLKGEFIISGSNVIQTLNVKFPVQNIKSGDRLMDKKTYETLNSSKNPTIAFTLTEPSTAIIGNNNDIQVTLTGNLTVAGVTKKVSFKSIGTKTTNGYQVSGTVPLKLSDFSMKAPTALLGMLKTGDAVTIKIEVNVPEQNLVAIY
jgi:polyisoprenoid-binding protein YceI